MRPAFEMREAAVGVCVRTPLELDSSPLSEVELAALRRHPDTFFGEVTPTPLRQGDYLGMYDFFRESMKKASKEDLLQALAHAPDFERLRGRSQAELASIHPERLTEGVMAMISKAKQSSR
jgi:hypothetical protein